MTKYRGYYIDHVVFGSKKDIDEFVKKQAVDSYKMAVEMFVKEPSMERSSFCSDKALNLVKFHGFTWNEVEQMEIDVIKNAA